MNTGTIVQVIGPVVDADFSETGVLPGIYDALEIDFEIPGSPAKKLTLEVQQHLGSGWVRAIAKLRIPSMQPPAASIRAACRRAARAPARGGRG